MNVSFDSHRVAYVDEKPFFLLGARHMPIGGTPTILAEAGFNAYRTLAFGHDVAEPEPPPAEDEPLFHWSYLFDRTILGRNSDYRRQLEAHLRQARRHPKLLCYENTNEVARHWKGSAPSVTPEELAEGTDLVRKLDPDHPIWIAHTRHRTVETLARYSPFGDITSCNCFPIAPPDMRQHIGVREDGRVQDCPDTSLHSMGRYTRKMMQVAGGRLAVWMQVQAMAYENWFNPKHAPEMAGQSVDQSKILYPTYEELRFMAFDAILCGSTGLTFAMYKTPVDSQMWCDICRVVGELKELTPILTSPPAELSIELTYEDLGYTIWDGVLTSLRRVGDDYCLIAANTAFDPARPTITIAGLSGQATAQVLGEDRDVPIQCGILTDDFAPYAVHTYRWTA